MGNAADTGDLPRYPIVERGRLCIRTVGVSGEGSRLHALFLKMTRFPASLRMAH